jgi:hypothetical protein
MQIKRITVFGGSQPKLEDPVYQDALRLGGLLGKAGYTILNGGYIGTMEAVSRGAVESGGHVIGITCDEIERWRPGGANRWIQEEIRYPTIRERMFALIDNCDAAIALPGGFGTLTEIAMMWNLIICGAIKPRPLIVTGPGWKATFEEFFTSLGVYIHGDQRQWLIFSPDVDTAFHLLVERL